MYQYESEKEYSDHMNAYAAAQEQAQEQAQEIKMWQEVENKEGTVSGLVYEITEESVKFRDEFGTNYRMKKRDVKPCSYMNYSEKLSIAEGFKHFKFRDDAIF